MLNVMLSCHGQRSPEGSALLPPWRSTARAQRRLQSRRMISRVWDSGLRLECRSRVWTTMCRIPGSRRGGAARRDRPARHLVQVPLRHVLHVLRVRAVVVHQSRRADVSTPAVHQAMRRHDHSVLRDGVHSPPISRCGRPDLHADARSRRSVRGRSKARPHSDPCHPVRISASRSQRVLIRRPQSADRSHRLRRWLPIALCDVQQDSSRTLANAMNE